MTALMWKVEVTAFVESTCGVCGVNQGFMQDQIIASHTRFGANMDVNC